MKKVQPVKPGFRGKSEMPGMDPCLGGLFMEQLQGRDQCRWRAASCAALLHPPVSPRETFIALLKDAARETSQLELCRKIATTIKKIKLNRLPFAACVSHCNSSTNFSYVLEI